VIGQAAAASPDANAYLAPWRTLLQGRPITLDLDDRGAVTAIRFDDDSSGATSTQARDELVQRLLALIVPLPAEPVGTGASWRAVTILRQGPAVAKQTAIYTLIARGPARWKLHVKLQRVGQRQPIVDPGLPPATAAELVALFRALEGDVEVDPALPLIAGGALTVESRLHARLQPPASAGQPRPAIVEQMFEDTGKVSFARCRPVASAAAHSASPGRRPPPRPAAARGLPRRLRAAVTSPLRSPARRAAEHDVVNVGPGAGRRRPRRIEAVAERVEQVARVAPGARPLADRHVVAEPGRADAAVGRDVEDEVTPEPDHVVLEVIRPAGLQR
jgi:hypothetical protein